VFQLDSARKGSYNLHETYHLPSAQFITPDDGHRICPKHVKFYDKINFVYLMHLVGCFLLGLFICVCVCVRVCVCVCVQCCACGFATVRQKHSTPIATHSNFMVCDIKVLPLSTTPNPEIFHFLLSITTTTT
jgi:hypothetical protein